MVVPYQAIPTFWRSWMYYLTPFRYIVDGFLGAAVHDFKVVCADNLADCAVNFMMIYACSWLYLGGARKIARAFSPAARKQAKAKKVASEKA